MFQIIFNELSAAEISQLDTMLQLELLTEFKVSPEDLQQVDGERFGKLERDVYTENDKLFTLDDLAKLLGALDYIHQKMQEQIESLLSN